MFALGKNIGYDYTGVVSAHKSDMNFSEKQREAWEMVRKSIDEGIPCYGWELEAAEFYIVKGYDDIGYYYNGPGADPIKGPKPWRELNNTGIGIIGMVGVKYGQPAGDTTSVKEALEFALEHSRDKKWVLPRYNSGLAGYDKWIETIEKGKANDLGMAYNAAVWTECRTMACMFIQEAKQKINGNIGPLLDEAMDSYYTIAESLNKLTDLFPMVPQGEINDTERCKKALVYLRRAREAEVMGLKSLEKIIAAL